MGVAGLRAQPQDDLEGDTDFEAVAGEREGEQPFGALEAVEDRVAVGVQGAGGAELLADVDAQRVAQFGVGVGECAKRPGDELAGALLVLEGEGDQLDVGEPRDPQVRPPGHQPLGGDRVEVAAPEPGGPGACGADRDPDRGVLRGRGGEGAGAGCRRVVASYRAPRTGCWSNWRSWPHS